MEEKQRKAASKHGGRVVVQERRGEAGGEPAVGVGGGGKGKRKALLHVPSGQVVSSYALLERILVAGLGWERYYDGDTLQYHKRGCVDLVRLPKDFARFGSVHICTTSSSRTATPR